VKYYNNAFIADSVFPKIKVNPKTQLFKYHKGAWFRDEAGLRAPGTESPRGSYSGEWVNIDLKKYSFASEVTDEDRDEAKLILAPPIAPDQDAVELATERVLLKKERLMAAAVTAGSWGSEDVEGGWAKTAPGTYTNTFYEDVVTRMDAMQIATGFRPNRLILDYLTLQHLIQEHTLLDRIKYTQKGVLSADLIASMLGLEMVLAGLSVYSSAKEKKDGSDFTSVSIWQKNANKGFAFLYYYQNTPSKKRPSAGYWCQYGTQKLWKWREESRHQDVYEVESEDMCIKELCSDMGYLFYDTIAT